MNNVASPTLTVRRITTADNAAIARVIRQVSAEYGLTADKGYTVADPNLDELYQVYSQPGAAYCGRAKRLCGGRRRRGAVIL